MTIQGFYCCAYKQFKWLVIWISDISTSESMYFIFLHGKIAFPLFGRTTTIGGNIHKYTSVFRSDLYSSRTTRAGRIIN